MPDADPFADRFGPLPESATASTSNSLARNVDSRRALRLAVLAAILGSLLAGMNLARVIGIEGGLIVGAVLYFSLPATLVAVGIAWAKRDQLPRAKRLFAWAVVLVAYPVLVAQIYLLRHAFVE